MRTDSTKVIPFFLFLLFASLLLMLFDYFALLRPIRGGIESLVVPTKTKIYQWRQPKGVAINVQKYQEEKEAKIVSLQSQIMVLKTENVAARRLLGAPLPPDWHFLPAQVMDLKEGLMEIDKGQLEGVKEGMVVVLEKVLVGKVTGVGEHFSQVLLPSAEEAKIFAISRSPQEEGIKAKGLVLGQAGRLIFDRVLLEEVLSEADLVLTAGDQFYPPNLLLGKITKVFKKENEVYQRAEIEPLVDPKHLEIVFVVISR